MTSSVTQTIKVFESLLIQINTPNPQTGIIRTAIEILRDLGKTLTMLSEASQAIKDTIFKLAEIENAIEQKDLKDIQSKIVSVKHLWATKRDAIIGKLITEEEEKYNSVILQPKFRKLSINIEFLVEGESIPEYDIPHPSKAQQAKDRLQQKQSSFQHKQHVTHKDPIESDTLENKGLSRIREVEDEKITMGDLLCLFIDKEDIASYVEVVNELNKDEAEVILNDFHENFPYLIRWDKTSKRYILSGINKEGHIVHHAIHAFYNEMQKSLQSAEFTKIRGMTIQDGDKFRNFETWKDYKKDQGFCTFIMS